MATAGPDDNGTWRLACFHCGAVVHEGQGPEPAADLLHEDQGPAGAAARRHVIEAGSGDHAFRIVRRSRITED